VSEQIIISRPDTAELSRDSHASIQEANALVVTSREQHEAGLTAYRTLGGVEKRIVDLFEAPKKAAHRAHKEITKAEKTLLAPVKEAKLIINKKLAHYEDEQDRIRKAKQAEAERKAREAEEEERLRAAQEAQDAGRDREAEEIISAPIEPPMVHVEPETAKVEGVSTQKRWSAEVTNKMALVMYVAANPDYIDLLNPDQPNLNRLAVSMKQNLNIPGVRAVSKTVRPVR
jgi:hypothetical protein